MTLVSQVRQRIAGLAQRPGRPDAADALLEEVDSLTRAGTPDQQSRERLLQLRHRAGIGLIDRDAPKPSFAPAAAAGLPADDGVPEVPSADLTPELLRAAMLRNGCLLVRGLVPPDDAARLVGQIDRAYHARDEHVAGGQPDPEYFAEFTPDDRFDLSWERKIILGAAGLWGADSPRVMVDVIETFERAGLRALATEYLGERSAISVNKCLLRRVSPDIFGVDEAPADKKPSAWHQDGAFLGDVQALNVWLALNRCGDEAPGMDVVPRRIDHIVATGTEGATNDWSVSRTVAEQAAGDTGIHRPVFEPGDALLFDELFLHSTAAEPTMPNSRYAVESWFFGPSAFPANYAPIAF